MSWRLMNPGKYDWLYIFQGQHKRRISGEQTTMWPGFQHTRGGGRCRVAAVAVEADREEACTVVVSGGQKKKRASNAKATRCMCMGGEGWVEGEDGGLKQTAKW